MKIKVSGGERVFDTVNILIMILLIVCSFYPILYVVFASLSDPTLMFKYYGALLKPLGFSMASYESVFNNPNIWSGYRNTLIIVLTGTALNIFMTILGGYVLSRRYLFWRRIIAMLIVFTMYFSGGLVPNFLLVQKLGLTNTLAALILPVAISTYNLMIMRTAFAAIPESMEESAMLDGANQITLLFRIMVPLVGPTLAVLVLYYGVQHWNSWFNALIYLRNKSLFPLQLVLREIVIQNSTSDMMMGAGLDDRAMLSETIKYATIVIATAPILVLYPFLQRYFVKGVMLGAVKG